MDLPNYAFLYKFAHKLFYRNEWKVLRCLKLHAIFGGISDHHIHQTECRRETCFHVVRDTASGEVTGNDVMQRRRHNDIANIWGYFVNKFSDIGVGFNTEFRCTCFCGFSVRITHGNNLKGVL
jgi:hypothetical protein